MENKYYTSLEITSTGIKMVVGYLFEGKTCVVDVVNEPCSGINQGLIVDSGIVSEKLKQIIIREQEKIHYEIKDVLLILPPFRLQCKQDSLDTTTVHPKNIITHVDVNNITTPLKKKNFTDPDITVLEAIPDSYFTANNEKYTEEPIGVESQTLRVHASIYSMSEKVVEMHTKVAEDAGLTPIRKIASPIVSSLALSQNPNIPDSYIAIDIGYSITSVSFVHNRTTIIGSKILPFGGKKITEAIAKDFGLSYEDAENLKCKYGIDKNPTFPVAIKDDIKFEDLSKSIINAFEESMVDIKKAIDSFDENKTLPLLITGGSSHLYHIESLFIDKTGRNIVNYYIETVGCRDKGMVNILGGIKYLDDRLKYEGQELVTSTMTQLDLKKIVPEKESDKEE